MGKEFYLCLAGEKSRALKRVVTVLQSCRQAGAQPASPDTLEQLRSRVPLDDRVLTSPRKAQESGFLILGLQEGWGTGPESLMLWRGALGCVLGALDDL